MITTQYVDGPQYAWSSNNTLDGEQSVWHSCYHIEVTPTTLDKIQDSPKVSKSIQLPAQPWKHLCYTQR